MRNIFILCAFLFLSGSSKAQELTAKEVIEKANNLLNQETVIAKAKMTITTTSGKKRELFYDSWAMDRGDKSLMRYTAPRRIKGQAMLMLNGADDIWSYDPRTNRVRKLATHAKKQKMQGSDFSYEDMGSGDSFLTDFNYKMLNLNEEKNDRDCYVIELTVKENVNSNYSRIVCWVDRDNFVIWSIDYYDEKDKTLKKKTLTQSEMKTIDDVPTPTKMSMFNHLDGSETHLELLEISYNVELDPAMFTERGLRK